MRLSVSLSGVLLFNNLCYAFCLRLMGRRPNPRRSVAPDSTKASPWIHGRVFKREFSDGGSAPLPPASPL